MAKPPPSRYASRSGEKLAAALAAFELDVTGWTCCDFGSHVGGFVDCLLQHGAARVYAVEPGYGVLSYRLRRDPRVRVHERTNALHFICPEPVDIVTIDVGWTPQRLILPAAAKCLKTSAAEGTRRSGRVISLIKPHYEAAPEQLEAGVVSADAREAVLSHVREEVEALGWRVLQTVDSPLPGHGGNLEQLWHLQQG